MRGVDNILLVKSPSRYSIDGPDGLEIGERDGRIAAVGTSKPTAAGVFGVRIHRRPIPEHYDMAKFDKLPMAELTATIERLQGELERRRGEESKRAVAEIRGKMDEFGLGIGDLGFSARELRAAADARGGGRATSPRGRRGTRTRKSTAESTDGRRIVKPKYRDPDTGTTWSGRGRLPRWMTAAIAQGKTREEFLIGE